MAVSAWRVLDGQSLTLYSPDNLQSTVLQRAATTLTVSSPVSIAGSLTVSSGTITGDGSGLTNLNASNLTAGTVPAARLANAVLIAPFSPQTVTYQGSSVSTVLKMAASPTANPFVIQDSTGSAVFAVDPTGAITTGTIPWESVSGKPTFVNSLTAGPGIQLSGSTGSITITNTGIISLQAGAGISVSGTNPAVITNTDPGSAQAIFKNIGDGSTTKLSATSNNDTFHLATGANVSLTWDTANKKVTVSAADMRPLAGSGILVSDRTVSVNFAGTGTATTVARSDHDHDTVYAKLTGNTNLSGTHVFTATQEAIRLTPASDPSQTILDELVTLAGTTTALLANRPVHARSETVRSLDGTVTYQRDDDYTIDYWTGTIARTATSAIPDGATVKVSYKHTKKLLRITDPSNTNDKFGIDTEGNIYASSITVFLSASSEQSSSTSLGDFTVQGNLVVQGSAILGDNATVDTTSVFGAFAVKSGTPSAPTTRFSVDPATGDAMLTGTLHAGGLQVGGTPVALSGHTHDDRYFTEAELATSGGGGAVHWNNVTNKPTFVNAVTAGAGISLSGSTGSVTITNTDRGSSQSIFKQIADGTGAVKFSASSNNDTLRLAADGDLSVAFDATTKTITYSFTESPDVDSITAGSGISVNQSTGAVTITNTDPGSAQAIFKNVGDGTTVKLSASSNSDTFHLVAGANIALTWDTTGKKVTISGSGIWPEADKLDGMHLSDLDTRYVNAGGDAITGPLGFRLGGVGPFYHRHVASYDAGSNATGAFVIETPIVAASEPTMMRVLVEGYFFDSTSPFWLLVGGYIYSPSLSFLNCGYINLGKKRLLVRWGRNTATGKVVLILGDVADVHQHPKLWVSLLEGYSGAKDAHRTGWSISLKTDLTGYDLLTTVPDVGAFWHAGNDGAGSGLDADLLDGQHGSYYLNASNLNAGNLNITRMPTGGNWDLTSNLTIETGLLALDITNGRVGVGTTAPAYKLDISGDVRWTGALQGGSVPWARLTDIPDASSSSKGVMRVGTGLTASTGVVNVDFPASSASTGWASSVARSDHFHPGFQDLPGPGVVHGLSVSAHATPDLGVQVDAGVAILRDGYRYELPSPLDVVLQGFVDGTNSRYVVLYVAGSRQSNPNNQIGVAAGPADGTLALPSLPSGAISLAKVLLTAQDAAITQDQITDAREFSPVRVELAGNDAVLKGRTTHTYGVADGPAWELASSGRLTLYGASAGISTDGGSTYVNLSSKAPNWDLAHSYYHRHVYDLPQLDVTDPFQKRYLLTYEPAAGQAGDAFPKRLMVFKNGLLMRQQKPGDTDGQYDYTVSGNAITFVQAPAAGDVILAFYEIVPAS